MNWIKDNQGMILIVAVVAFMLIMAAGVELTYILPR